MILLTHQAMIGHELEETTAKPHEYYSQSKFLGMEWSPDQNPDKIELELVRTISFLIFQYNFIQMLPTILII